MIKRCWKKLKRKYKGECIMYHKNVCLIIVVFIIMVAISPIVSTISASAENPAKGSGVLDIDVSKKSVRLGETVTIFASFRVADTRTHTIKLEVFDTNGINRDSSEKTIDPSPNTQLLTRELQIKHLWPVGEYWAVVTLLSNGKLIDRKEENFHVSAMGKKHGEVAALVYEDFISDDLEFLNYDYDIYDETNIQDLFIEKTIYQYKSILVGSYATDKPIIRSTLAENREKLEEYIDDGGGVVVLAQHDYVTWLHKNLALPIVAVDHMHGWLHGDKLGGQIDWYTAESDLPYNPNDLDEYKGGDTAASNLYSRCFYTEGIGWPTSTDDAEIELFTCNDYRIVTMEEWFWDTDLSVWMAKDYGKGGRISLTTIPIDEQCGSIEKNFYSNRWTVDNMIEWTESNLHRVNVRIFPEEVRVNPDESTEVVIMVTNSGNEKCDIDVVVKTGVTRGKVKASWVDWIMESLEDVPPGDVKVLKLEIKPQEGEDPDEYSFDVEAVPTKDSGESEKVTGTVKVNPYKNLKMTIGTGETKYESNELVRIRGSIENTGNIDLKNIAGKISIVGPGNVHVDDIAIFTGVELDAGETTTFMALNSYKMVTWDVEDSPHGKYTSGVYFFDRGNLLAKKNATFVIEEDMGTKVTPIFTDASSYDEDERIVITRGKFENIGNVVIEGTFVIKIQEFGKNGWKDKKTVVDTYHKLGPGEEVDLKEIWEDAGGWKAKGDDDKSYRVYAAILGSDGKPIEYGDWMEDEEIETVSLFRIRNDDAGSWFEDLIDAIDIFDVFDDDDNFLEGGIFDIFGDDDSDDDDKESFFEEFFDQIFGDSNDEAHAETTQIDSNVAGEPTVVDKNRSDEQSSEAQDGTRDRNDGVELCWDIADEEYEI